jgi:23S rRNA pseudouridine1911/1915/1917 synthase
VARGVAAIDYLAGTHTHSSRHEWVERFERDEIEIDGVTARPGDVLAGGQTIVWHRPPWQEPDVPLDYRVIYEDAALVVVDKPRGLPTMAAGGFLAHTLLTLVTERYPDARPLHRLGRHTSGLVLFARTHEAASALARAWRDREVLKVYRALASGVAAFDRLDVTAPIGRVPHPRLGRVYAASPDGKPAHSTLVSLERRSETTLFSVTIATGRPHQIRIHCAAAGHPLAGDPLYDVGGVVRSASPGLPGDGGYLLHAESLRVVHPSTGATIELHAPPPPDLSH